MQRIDEMRVPQRRHDGLLRTSLHQDGWLFCPALPGVSGYGSECSSMPTSAAANSATVDACNYTCAADANCPESFRCLVVVCVPE